MTEWFQERQAIERECERLVIAFCNHNDARDYAALADLFTEDGVFARPSDPSNPIKGRANIRERFSAKPRELLTRHLVTNVLITVESREAARGVSYMTLFTGQEPEGAKLPVPASPTVQIGQIASRFVRTIHGWRIAEHLGSLALTYGAK
jgi:ketosteroid isomerase-like protein